MDDVRALGLDPVEPPADGRLHLALHRVRLVPGHPPPPLHLRRVAAPQRPGHLLLLLLPLRRVMLLAAAGVGTVGRGHWISGCGLRAGLDLFGDGDGERRQSEQSALQQEINSKAAAADGSGILCYANSASKNVLLPSPLSSHLRRPRKVGTSN